MYTVLCFLEGQDENPCKNSKIAKFVNYKVQHCLLKTLRSARCLTAFLYEQPLAGNKNSCIKILFYVVSRLHFAC